MVLTPWETHGCSIWRTADMKTKTQYPPKHPSNGTRHFTSAEVYSGGPGWDPWPGDTMSDIDGKVWTYASDGSGWQRLSESAKDVA